MNQHPFAFFLLVTTVKSYGVKPIRRANDDEGVNVVKDTKGEFAYVVSLQEWSPGPNETINVARLGIGSALTKNWILTAGHCITDTLTHVEYGQAQKNHTQIISKHLHPSYRMYYSYGGYYAILNNNIALVKVKDMDLKEYGKLSAREYSTVLGEVVKYAGYGGIKKPKSNPDEKKKDEKKQEEKKQEEKKPDIARDKKENENISPSELRVVEGGIIRCEQERYIIFHPALCVAPRCSNRKQKTTQGDSGGPLTLNTKIIGVNSGNSPVAGDIFTPVSPYFEWISGTINKHGKNGF